MNRTYDKNEVIFRQGEPADSMYEVTAGRVGIYANFGAKNEKQLTVLEPGSVFGEMGMIEQLPRSATAVALEEGTQAQVITADGFAAYFQSSPEKVLAIMRHMSGRIRGLTHDYLDACRAVAEYEEAAGNGKKSSWLKAHFRKFVQDYADATVYLDQQPDYFGGLNGQHDHFLL